MNKQTQKFDLSIIIVTWNVRKFLKACLLSVFNTIKHYNYEVIVIDNNSRDGTAAMIETEFPVVNLIKNSNNVGFATASNQGLSQAKGKYLLFLNPDTILLENSVDLSLPKMENEPLIGVLGGRILNPDLTLQPSCRRFPDLFSQLLIMMKWHRIFPKNRRVKKYLMSDWLHNESRTVDQVMGAFFLTKREVVEKVGSFDEKFKFWFEEVDFCRRVKNMGYEVFFYHDAKIIHHKGESFKQESNLIKQIYYNNSLVHYFEKNHQVVTKYIIILFYPISLLLALISQLLPGANSALKRTRI